MKRRFGDGPVSRLLSALFDLVMINLLLIVCSLPLFTAGAAACGAFMAVRSVLQDGRSSAVGTFFSGFRENFRQGAALSVILALFCAVGFFAAVYVVNLPQSAAVDFFYRATFFFALIVAFLILAVACPVLSRFRFKTAQILLFSLRAALRFPLRTLGLAALWAALGAAFRFFPPALILAPGLGTFAATFLLEPAFRHYMPERSEFDEGTDTWYLE